MKANIFKIGFLGAAITGVLAASSFTENYLYKRYGGSASVQVTYTHKYETSKTRTQILEANISCSENDISAAKSSLRRALEHEMSFNAKPLEAGVFTSTINYNIDSCEN